MLEAWGLQTFTYMYFLTKKKKKKRLLLLSLEQGAHCWKAVWWFWLLHYAFTYMFCYFVFLRRWMAQRGLENTRCKRCVRVTTVNNKFDVLIPVRGFCWVFIIQNHTVQLAGADLVAYKCIYFGNKYFKVYALKKEWQLKTNRLTYVMALI